MLKINLLPNEHRRYRGHIMNRYKTSDSNFFNKFDKCVGLPSLGAIVLGTGLLFSASGVKIDYRNFVNEVSNKVPAVRQIDHLDNANSNLYSAEKALTRYMVGKTHHNPNPVQSADYLSNARITSEDFPKNYEIQTIDDQIRITERELAKLPTGEYESFYEPQRDQIKGIEQRVENEIYNLKESIPTEIREKQETLKNKYNFRNNFGIFSAIIGVGGVLVYCFFKLFGLDKEF